MKRVLIAFLDIYKVFVSPLLLQLVGQQGACKYKVSCSRYAKLMIQSEGVVKGLYLATKRVLSCR